MKKLFLLLPLMALVLSCSQDVYEQNSGLVPENETETTVTLYGEKSLDSETRAVSPHGKTWEIGQTITIKFLPGSDVIKNDVLEYATEWMEHANVTFQFVEANQNADIRIAYQWEGDGVTWSYVGTDARQVISQNQPTMNFGSRQPLASLRKGDVLRQFGHVLGLVNEHQTVDSPIDLIVDDVYEYYLYYGWSVMEVTDFFFKPYNRETANYTQYDSRSIMCWDIPSFLDRNGVGQSKNNVLSEMDKTFVRQLYPFDMEHILDVSLSDTTFVSGKGIEIHFNVNSNTEWKFNPASLPNLISATPSLPSGGYYDGPQDIVLVFAENDDEERQARGSVVFETKPDYKGYYVTVDRHFLQPLNISYVELIHESTQAVRILAGYPEVTGEETYTTELRSDRYIQEIVPDYRMNIISNGSIYWREPVQNYDGTYSWFVTADRNVRGMHYFYAPKRLILCTHDVFEAPSTTSTAPRSGGTAKTNLLSNLSYKARLITSVPSGVQISLDKEIYASYESISATFDPSGRSARTVQLELESIPFWKYSPSTNNKITYTLTQPAGPAVVVIAGRDGTSQSNPAVIPNNGEFEFITGNGVSGNFYFQEGTRPSYQYFYQNHIIQNGQYFRPEHHTYVTFRGTSGSVFSYKLNSTNTIVWFKLQ